MKRKLQRVISLFTIITLLTMSCLSAFAASPITNSASKSQNLDQFLQSNGNSDFNNFLHDVDNFKQFIQSKKSTQGALSTDDFNYKCAVEYYNQKVEDSKMSGSLLDSNVLASSSKAQVRANLMVASELMSLTLPKTAFFMQHSLQDFPSDLSLAPNDSIVFEIKSTSAYLTAINEAKKSKVFSTTTYPVFTAKNSNWDLYLSLHKTTMKSEKGINSILISNITDTYNFEYHNYTAESGISGKAITIINDYAVIGIEDGAIRPYNINIAIHDTY